MTAQADPPGPAWTAAPDLLARTAWTIETAARAWGDAGRSTSGLAVAYESQVFVCGGVLATGCAEGGGGSWALRVYASSAPCVEGTPLPHEIGHVVLGGDAAHADPRWHDAAFWNAMAAALAAGAATDDPACAAFLGQPDALLRVDGD